MPGSRTVRTAVVVLAGGSGSRIGAAVNKVYLPLAGRSVLAWSFDWARSAPGVVARVLVTRPEDDALARAVVGTELPGQAVDVVTGGATRHGSEQAALAHLAPRIHAGEGDVVVVHDGARPLATPDLWSTVVSAADRVGGALPVVAADGVLRTGADGAPTAAEEPGARAGEHLVRVQTPQAFRARELLDAYARARAAGDEGTDTASTVEAFSDLVVTVVPGSAQNLKMTWPQDVHLAERLLAARQQAAG